MTIAILTLCTVSGWVVSRPLVRALAARGVA